MVEIAIRYRCNTCNMAVEFLSAAALEGTPAELNGVQAPPLPRGWSIDRGDIGCTLHPLGRVKPALVLPGHPSGN